MSAIGSTVQPVSRGIGQVLAAVSLLAIMPPTVSAAPEAWMRNARPDELPVMVLLGDGCPVTRDDLVESVEDVLVRSGISFIGVDQEVYSEAFDISNHPRPWLQVQLSCFEETHALSIDVDFIGIDVETGMLFRYLPASPYTMVGNSDDSGFVLSGVQNAVQVAVTDYLQANVAQ